MTASEPVRQSHRIVAIARPHAIPLGAPAGFESDELDFLVQNGPDIASASIIELRPDLVIIDLDLHGESGIELLASLRDDPSTHQIPVILTGKGADARTRARGLDAGAVDFVVTPCDDQEFLARIRVALRTKELLELLEERAHIDGLTGLGNRHAFDERLSSMWAGCRRRGTPLSLLMIDLDRFKTVNDCCGHPVGDQLLRHAAWCLRRTLRPTDFIARYGGDEFVVIAPDCDLLGAVAMAERIRVAMIEVSSLSRDRAIPVTASIGVAVTLPRGHRDRAHPNHVALARMLDASDPPDSADTDGLCPVCRFRSAVACWCGAELGRIAYSPQQLLAQADCALYHAKSAGRDAAWFWDSARDHASSARVLDEMLEELLTPREWPRLPAPITGCAG